MKIRSLRFRLALWVGGFLLASLLLFGVYVYVSMSNNLNAALDDALRSNAVQAMGTVNVNNDQIVLPDGLAENSSDAESAQARGFTVRFLDAKGTLLGGFGANWTTPLPAAPTGKQASFTTVTSGNREPDARVYTLPITDNNRIVGYVQTSQSLEAIQQTLERLQLSLLLGIPFLTLLAALGGYFLAGRALAPVDAITRTARRISAEDLSARLHLPDNGDEVGRLASTFDDMLARLDDSFRRERQFTSDASHELRTPLAAMQTIIGVTRSQKRRAAEYEQALDDLGEETGRLRAMTENLLMLARGEQPVEAQRERVDLSSLLSDVAESLAPLADSKGLKLECRASPNITVQGDRDALIRLFVNLADNAIKFTESGGVTLSAQLNGKNIRVAVADTGKGIPLKHLEYIFDRFYRVDSSRAQTGAGLGLAIALQIARAHGGDVAVKSELGRGTTFWVTLPAS